MSFTEPVRVVIDANVFVSAAIGRGPSTRLIDQWMSGQASFEGIVRPVDTAFANSHIDGQPLSETFFVNE